MSGIMQLLAGSAAGPGPPYNVDLLLIGGGGAGASNTHAGGGGGGGEAVYQTGIQVQNLTQYTITVGGGAASPGFNAFGANGANGGDSSALSYATTNDNGADYLTPFGALSSKTINGSTTNYTAGGISGAANGAGGGAGSGGNGLQAQAGNTGAAGGPGYANSITGSSVSYSGGGGGGSHDSTNAAGGAGGGGAGSSISGGVGAGTTNTGGGGGGSHSGYFSGSNVAPAAGGSGKVILRIPTANYSSTTTGSPSVSTDGSYTVLQYTSSGSYTA